MKEKLTLRNVILWGLALVLVILFLVSFGASVKWTGTMDGDYGTITLPHGFWGASAMTFTSGGHYAAEFIPVAARRGSVVGIIGAILLFLSAGGIALITLLLKDEKLKKILTFVIAGVILVAGVLMFFTGGAFYYAYAKYMRVVLGLPVSVDQVKEALSNGHAYCVYGIVTGVFSILLSAGIVVSQLVIKDIKFIKSKEA